MFKFATWVIVSIAMCLGVQYYNTVESPDLSLPAALAQFENRDDAAKEFRRQVYIQNTVNMSVFTVWVGFTALCFYGDLKRGVKTVASELKEGLR